jgi:type IV fimbrial biogenesis protein FimT
MAMQRAPSRHGKNKAFTLVELMAVLSIAAVLIAIGAPGFRALIESQQMTTTVNDFFAAINLARSEAIKRGERVELMAADGDGHWEKGWVVLLDTNHTGKPDTGDEIIFSHGPVPDGITIDPRLPDKAVQYLAYDGTGHAPAGSFWLSRGNKVERKIKINFLGRPRVCNPATDRDSC